MGGGGDGFDPRLSELRDELDAARELAATALRENADAQGLREAAGRLGRVLGAVAEDQTLWDAVSAAPEQRPPLTDEQAMGLEATAFVDWQWLLDRIGYRPPPDLDVSAAELALATAQMLAGGEPANVDETRERLHRIGAALREDADDPHVPKRRRRRRLRGALKIAAKVSIVLGVGVAAAVAVPAAAPVGILGGIVLQEAVVRGLSWTIARIWREEPEPEPPDLAQEALRALAWLDPSWFERLHDGWGAVGGHAADSEPVARLLVSTHALVERLFVAFYELRDIALDAPWGDAVEPELRLLRELLQLTRRELCRGPGLDGLRLADLLAQGAGAIARLRTMLVQLVGRGR